MTVKTPLYVCGTLINLYAGGDCDGLFELLCGITVLCLSGVTCGTISDLSNILELWSVFLEWETSNLSVSEHWQQIPLPMLSKSKKIVKEDLLETLPSLVKRWTPALTRCNPRVMWWVIKRHKIDPMVSKIQPNSLANAGWRRIIGFRGISGQWVVVSKDQWTCLLFHRLCREQLNAFVKTRGWSPSSSFPPPLQISPPPPPCRWLSWLIWTNNPLLPPLQGQVQVQPLQTLHN